MTRFARRAVPVLALVAMATAGVADAAAATRHVAPAGGGGECSQTAPCDIGTGIEGAASGDEVVLAAGAYNAGGIAFPTAGGVSVRGAVIGPGRPVITTGGIIVRGAGSLLSDVEIRGLGPAAALTVIGGGRGDRLLVRGAAGAPSTACTVAAATLTNSVCLGGEVDGAAGVSQSGGGSAIRNVTAVSGGYGVTAPSGDAAPLTNAIARGASGHDVHRVSGLIAMSLTHCYAPALEGGPFSSVNRVTSGLAVRVDPTDLRQAAGSTTLDAGTPSGVAAGELDLNGNLRIVGDDPDIGAYEQVPAPSATAGTVDVTPTTATVRPTVTTGGGRTQVTVRYGVGPALGVAPDEATATAPAGAAPGVVEVPLTGLAAFTTYGYRVTVTSDGGTGESAIASFTTPAKPASSALLAPSRIGKDRVSLAGTVDTGGAPGDAHFELRPVGGGRTAATPPRTLLAADGPRPVAALVTELGEGTEYRVVLVVTTPAAGAVRSDARTFTTLGTPPSPPGARPDTRKPRVTVRLPGAIRIGRRGVLVARVTCDERCTLTVRARLGIRGGRPASFRLLPDARITLRLRPVRRTRLIDVDDVRLSLTGARRAALTALRAGRRVVVRIDVQAKDAAGNVRLVRTFVSVRR